MNLFTGEVINISSTRPFKAPILVTLRNKGKWHWCNRSIVACALYPQRRLIWFFPLLVLIKSLCSRKMEKFSGKSSKLPFPPLCLIQFVLSKILSGEQIIKQVPSSTQGMPSMSFSLHWGAHSAFCAGSDACREGHIWTLCWNQSHWMWGQSP